jgi:hypothetical protein
MNDQIRQRAKEKLMQTQSSQANAIGTTNPPNLNPSQPSLQTLISNLELLQQFERQAKPIQALVEAVKNLTPESQLQPQLVQFQQQIQEQIEQLNQQIASLNHRSQTTVSQMTLILSELQISTPVLKQLLPQLQDLLEQTKKQTDQQEKQLNEIQQTVSQLTQPLPIKLNWLRIYGMIAMFAISTGCTIVLMLRLLPATTVNLNQPNQPHQTQKRS